MIIILQTQFQCQAAFNYRHDSSLWSHPIDLVYLIHDRTEVSIQKVADTNQRMRRMKSQGEELGELNFAIQRDLELQIKNLQNVLRGPEKLELLLKVKSKDKRKKKKQST
jgi:hypothetical protein